MSEVVTKQDLKELAETIRTDFRVELKDATSEIVAHFNKSQALQNDRMDRTDGRMDRMEGRMDRMEGDIVEIKGQLGTIAEDVGKIKLAVLDLMATDRHLHNLVRELKGKGIALDEVKIFAM